MVFPSVSVIVPVYKVELYLQECIDSILAQTYADFELILVDDGSPDKSGDICDSAVATDARVRVFHQANQGVTRARAKGVAMARGEFVTFVDGDDYIPSHALEAMVQHADAATDIVLSDIEPWNRERLSPGEIPLTEYRQMCVVLKQIHNGPVSKLFRRSLFNEYVFDMPRDLRMGEDAIMNIRLAYRAQGRIYNTGKTLYVYRLNEQSVMHTNSLDVENLILMEKYRLTSFPSEDLALHVRAGLYESLISHWNNALHVVPRLPAAALEYRRFLLSIKKESGYRFNIYTYILFHCPNQFCLSLAYGLFNMVRGLRRALCRRKKKSSVSCMM